MDKAKRIGLIALLSLIAVGYVAFALHRRITGRPLLERFPDPAPVTVTDTTATTATDTASTGTTGTMATSATDTMATTTTPAFPANYPSKWPHPFFEETIEPGSWGTWLAEPNSPSGARDWVWYWITEPGGTSESVEWGIQCEAQNGSVIDVEPGKNERCENYSRIRIRNDWGKIAKVFYFKRNG